MIYILLLIIGILATVPFWGWVSGLLIIKKKPQGKNYSATVDKKLNYGDY